MQETESKKEENKVLPPRQIRMAQYAAFVLIVITLYLSGKTMWFIAMAESVKGNIIAMSELPNCDKHEDACYTPMFRFYVEEKPGWFKKYELKANFSSGDHNLYNVGETIEVLYPKHDPGKAVIRSFWALWLGSLITSIFAFVLSATTLAAVASAEDDITPTVIPPWRKRLLKYSLWLPVIICVLALALTYL